MTRSFSPDSFPTPEVAAYYARRAAADVGLIISEGTGVARRLGFECVEIHDAHGYLIDQFFCDGTNDRHDWFGGASIQERARFAAEVVAQVKADVGPDFAIILRLSRWNKQDYRARLARTPDQLAEWLTPLVEAGADVLHCSQRRFWEPEFPELDGEAGLILAGWAKKFTGAATISVGSVGLSGELFGAFAGEGARAADLSTLIGRMERDEFDLIAVGRVLLQDPLWATKIGHGPTGDLMNFDAAALGFLL